MHIQFSEAIMSKSGRRAVILALLATLLAGLAPAWAREPIRYLKEVEGNVFQLTNEVRRDHYLAPLGRDTSLIDAARVHSDDMLREDFFSHDNPNGTTPEKRIAPAFSHTLARVGENIWGGHGYDYSDATLMARIIVDSWMSSPGHRANLLNPNYTHMGVGVAAMGPEIRATQDFIQQR
jgi:uncharacterized protein YkwD